MSGTTESYGYDQRQVPSTKIGDLSSEWHTSSKAHLLTDQVSRASGATYDDFLITSRCWWVQRCFDVIISVFLLILFSPAFLLITIVIRIKAPTVPIFFGVEVLGCNRRPFKMWKFSTMVRDADRLLDQLFQVNPALKLEWTLNVKLKDDPRILPVVGSLLRNTSLNELPQLWNVLIGEMSIVGPRPITALEEDQYLRYGNPGVLRARHAQRPGITGLWQATGRSDVTYEERVRIDTKYLTVQSLLFDLKIVGLTVRKVLSRKGAI